MGRLPKYSVTSLLVTVFIFFLDIMDGFSQDGQELFTQNCAVCHTIGGGVLVGPDLKGVSEKREESWLIAFIRSSQTLINAGDDQAVAIFQQNNRMPMPDFPFSDNEVKAILDYINIQSGETNAVQSDQRMAGANLPETEPTITPAEKPPIDKCPYQRMMFWSFTLAVVAALALIYYTSQL